MKWTKFADKLPDMGVPILYSESSLKSTADSEIMLSQGRNDELVDYDDINDSEPETLFTENGHADIPMSGCWIYLKDITAVSWESV